MPEWLSIGDIVLAIVSGVIGFASGYFLQRSQLKHQHRMDREYPLNFTLYEQLIELRLALHALVDNEAPYYKANREKVAQCFNA